MRGFHNLLRENLSWSRSMLGCNCGCHFLCEPACDPGFPSEDEMTKVSFYVLPMLKPLMGAAGLDSGV